MRKRSFTNMQTIFFIILISIACALILSILASVLRHKKEEARTVDRSEQMLIAAKVFTHEGLWQIEQNGSYVPATLSKEGRLVPAVGTPIVASKAEVLSFCSSHIVSALVTRTGDIVSYADAHFSEEQYLKEHKKLGFQNQDYFPIFQVYIDPVEPSKEHQKPFCYVIPVSGFGLWDYIFGFIGIKPDGVTVQGISWYEHKETPGLGANISEESWQKQFYGKTIFQPDSEGKIDLDRSQIGLTVVKGTVREIIGTSPKSKAFVDGMAGATLTGNGVTRAYKDTLELYRPFFQKLYTQWNLDKTAGSK